MKPGFDDLRDPAIDDRARVHDDPRLAPALRGSSACSERAQPDRLGGDEQVLAFRDGAVRPSPARTTRTRRPAGISPTADARFASGAARKAREGADRRGGRRWPSANWAIAPGRGGAPRQPARSSGTAARSPGPARRRRRQGHLLRGAREQALAARGPSRGQTHERAQARRPGCGSCGSRAQVPTCSATAAPPSGRRMGLQPGIA